MFDLEEVLSISSIKFQSRWVLEAIITGESNDVLGQYQQKYHTKLKFKRNSSNFTAWSCKCHNIILPIILSSLLKRSSK